MRKTFTSIIPVVMALTILFVLTSCGSTSEKNETEILADIQREDPFFLDYDLRVDSSAITKRQTNTDDKTDYVWLELTASNDAFTYYSEYALIYVLYNDGWMLEEYEKISHNILPNWYPDASDACGDFDTFCSNYTFGGEVDRGDTYIIYQATYSSDYLYLTTTYDATIEYTFSPQTGWTEHFSKKETGYALDIVGEWLYEDAERYYYVDVISVGENWTRNKLWGYCTTDVELTYHIEGDSYLYESKTPVTWKLSEYDSNNAAMRWWSFSSEGLPDDISLYAGREKSDGESGMFYCEKWTSSLDHVFNMVRVSDRESN